MKKAAWPKLVRNGSVTVKIYRVDNKKALARKPGRQQAVKSYTQYVVSYYVGEKRVRKTYSGLAKAEQEAVRVATMLSTGEREALRLTGADSSSYVRAKSILRSLNVPLLAAVEEYAAAKKLGVPMLLAAKHYADRQRTVKAKRTIEQVKDEFINAKESDGMSLRYISDCRSRLGRFSRDIKADITSIDSSILAAWLRALGQSARSRNNYRAMVQALFRFARSTGYLPKNEPTAADDLPLAKDPGGVVGIFKPAQFVQLLVADPTKLKVKGHRDFLVPYLVLGGFCGLRHAEIDRLEWSDIDLAQKIVRVTAAKAKTASNRVVPICESGIKLLLPHAKTDGHVCSDRQSKYARNVATKLGVPWPANGLRHSFGSYRLAQVKSAPQVALEMGNSPQMVFKHYRQVVTETDAETWFAGGLCPAQ